MSTPPILVRLYRLAAIALAVWLIHDAWHRHGRPRIGVTLDEARALFPEADRLGALDARGAQTVLGPAGERQGLVLRTSPDSDDRIGYAGPSDLLVGLSADGQVKGVRLLSSQDTEQHVRDVRESPDFWRAFEGRRTDELRGVQAVSGSTLTSYAMIEAIEKRLHGEALSLRFPDAVTLDETRALFPAATRLDRSPDGARLRVIDGAGNPIGLLLRTSPEADNVAGYAGPTEALVALDAAGQEVLGVQLRRSYDSPGYVTRVREGTEFLEQLSGWTVEEWSTLDLDAAGIEGVSGATQTSYAVAEGIRRRLARDNPAALRSVWRTGSLFLIIVGALVLSFWPRARRGRRLWQVILVVGLGIALGDLLSLALLAGWSRHGVPWDNAPALAALVGVALLVPWTTRRQVYCHALCPHGAVQEWVGVLRRRRVRIPRRLFGVLRLGPAMILVGAAIVAFVWPRFDLATLEPFHGWVVGTAAIASLTIAVLGVLACLFVPMAYCRFGCPTGALLDFLRSRGGAIDSVDGISGWRCCWRSEAWVSRSKGAWVGRAARGRSRPSRAERSEPPGR